MRWAGKAPGFVSHSKNEDLAEFLVAESMLLSILKRFLLNRAQTAGFLQHCNYTAGLQYSYNLIPAMSKAYCATAGHRIVSLCLLEQSSGSALLQYQHSSFAKPGKIPMYVLQCYGYLSLYLDYPLMMPVDHTAVAMTHQNVINLLAVQLQMAVVVFYGDKRVSVQSNSWSKTSQTYWLTWKFNLSRNCW